jgi:predicted nuclease of predicted toxin-antitoxin system
MKVLLDENLSPALVPLLGALGVAARHVVHLGRAGLSDPDVWRLAFAHDEVVATINAADFLTLARASELHPGLVVLRSQGLSREAQWLWLKPVMDHVLGASIDLTNQVIEVTGPGRFVMRPLPQAS